VEFNNEALGLRLGLLEEGFNEGLGLGLGMGVNDEIVLMLTIVPLLL